MTLIIKARMTQRSRRRIRATKFFINMKKRKIIIFVCKAEMRPDQDDKCISKYVLCHGKYVPHLKNCTRIDAEKENEFNDGAKGSKAAEQQEHRKKFPIISYISISNVLIFSVVFKFILLLFRCMLCALNRSLQTPQRLSKYAKPLHWRKSVCSPKCTALGHVFSEKWGLNSSNTQLAGA